jgi:hypothetical protein
VKKDRQVYQAYLESWVRVVFPAQEDSQVYLDHQEFQAVKDLWEPRVITDRPVNLDNLVSLVLWVQ